MERMPVFAIVGKSSSGKTVLMEQLIAEFKRRGYKVAALKHAAGGMEMDQPGKDSWRLARAGSDAVFVSSPDKLAFIKKVEHDLDIEEILPIVGAEFDLILAEGFRKGKIPKIEVHRKELGEDLLCSPGELSAVVSDEPLNLALPQFSRGDVARIADFIEDELGLKGRDDVFSPSGRSKRDDQCSP